MKLKPDIFPEIQVGGVFCLGNLSRQNGGGGRGGLIVLLDSGEMGGGLKKDPIHW